MSARVGVSVSDAEALRKSEPPGGGGECGLGSGKRRSSKESVRGNHAEGGRSVNHGPRWQEIDRIPGRLKQSLGDVWRGFVVSMSYARFSCRFRRPKFRTLFAIVFLTIEGGRSALPTDSGALVNVVSLSRLGQSSMVSA